ncbi:MAG: alpha/beta hydrolase [Actinomycetota bacterium]|nr:alpha/beta hydrolase [Actinomycetota bacterium]
MSRCTFVWAHGLNSCMAHEDELGLFDWSCADSVARVVRYDARGHGGCECTQFEDRAYRWSALVDDMLRAPGQGPFVAGGASMGAATALYAAVRAPRRVQGLVIVTPPSAWETRPPQAEAYQAAARLVERRGIPGYLNALQTAGPPRILADELPEASTIWLRHLRRMDEKVVPCILRGAALSDLPRRDELHSVVVPTLILAWTDDPAHPVSTAENLAELMVMSELHVASDLAGIRRWPQLVRDFLGGICQWGEFEEAD